MASIDLHAHILPGVDDGPDTLEGALALARAAVAAGTAELAATPHVNERRYIEAAEIAPKVRELQGVLDAAGIALELHTGAEIALHRLLDLSEIELSQLTLGTGRYLLLESPFAAHAADVGPIVHDALARGYGVVLAHPERSPGFQRDPTRLARLADAGALVQVTAGALTGDFGERVRQFSLQLLRENLVHLVSSDTHDHLHRPPGTEAAVLGCEREVPGVAARVDWLTREAPAAILVGAPLPAVAPLPMPSRTGAWRRRFARAASSAR